MNLIGGKTVRKIGLECELWVKRGPMFQVLPKSILLPFYDSLQPFFSKVHKLIEWSKHSHLFLGNFWVCFFKFLWIQKYLIWWNFQSMVVKQSLWKRGFIGIDMTFLKQSRRTSNHTRVGNYRWLWVNHSEKRNQSYHWFWITKKSLAVERHCDGITSKLLKWVWDWKMLREGIRHFISI